MMTTSSALPADRRDTARHDTLSAGTDSPRRASPHASRRCCPAGPARTSWRTCPATPTPSPGCWRRRLPASLPRCTPSTRRGTRDIEETVARARPRRPGRGTRRVRGPARPRRSWACDGRPGPRRTRGCRGGEPAFALRTLGSAPPRGGGDPPRRPRPRLRARRLARGLLAAVVRQRQDELAALPRRLPVDGARRHRRRRARGSSAPARGRRSAARSATWPGGWSAAAAGDGLTCSSGELPTLGSVEMTLSRQGPAPAVPRTSGELAAADDHEVRRSARWTTTSTCCAAGDRRAGADRRRRRRRAHPAASSATAGCAASSPPTSTGTTTGRCPRWSRRPAPRRSRAPRTPTSCRCPVDRRVGGRRRRRGRRLPARGDPPRRPHPRLDRAAVRRPRRHAAPVHRRLALPGRRRQDLGRRSDFASADRTTSRPSSSTGCPTRPGSTPATATTRPSARSARTSRSGATGAGDRRGGPTTLRPNTGRTGPAPLPSDHGKDGGDLRLGAGVRFRGRVRRGGAFQGSLQGKQGETGLTGAPGPAGPAGQDGADGVDGKDGKAGKAGKAGKTAKVQAKPVDLGSTGCSGQSVQVITDVTITAAQKLKLTKKNVCVVK